MFGVSRMRDRWPRAPEWQLFLAYGVFSGVVYGVGHWLGDWSFVEAAVLAVLVGFVHGGLDSARAVEDREELRRVVGPEWTTDQIGQVCAPLRARFDVVDETAGQLHVDFNVAPTKPVPAVLVDRELDGRGERMRRLRLLRWGC